jgi:hypothetical protein
MKRLLPIAAVCLLSATPLFAQSARVWVLRAPEEMVEYDAETFAVKQTVKVPLAAVKAPQSVSVNRAGQILFVPAVTLPLSEDEADEIHKVWFWNGKAASTIDQGISRATAKEGSNVAVTDVAPVAYLAADGTHLFWFANQQRRLQREEMDLSTLTTWLVWRTDLTGSGREDVASTKLPDCRCTTGSCEENCPSGQIWAPDAGVEKFFVVTQFVAGQTGTIYKSSARYDEQAGKWNATALIAPMQRLLDAASDGKAILEAIPDTGCCGWSNQSNDQTLLVKDGKTLTVFDEQAAFKNSDYDVSFYSSAAKLSPEGAQVAMTIAATAKANQPIQLAEQGQANPEESASIRKALAELPAVEIKSVEDTPKRILYMPHAQLVGWISEKEILMVEEHVLVGYNLVTKARRKSTIRVEDVARVFLR